MKKQTTVNCLYKLTACNSYMLPNW